MYHQAENVDQAEIDKFSELAARWWDPESEFAPLHAINPLRTDYINLHTPVNDQRVLDVGCGGGLLCESLAEKGAKVSGIDLAEAGLSVAKLHLKESGLQVDYQHRSAEDLAQDHANQFDVVTCLEMLEHVPDPDSVIRSCAQLVKPGGTVYFSTINRNPKAWLFAIVGAEYVLNLLPRGTHEYQKLIKPSELERSARNAGLQTQHIIGLHYNPLMQTYKLAPGTDVNYLMRTVKTDA